MSDGDATLSDDADITADPANPVHQAWLTAAAADPARHAELALEFFRDCIGLFGPADAAGKTNDLAELQKLEMRAKSMQTRGKALIGGWGQEFAALTHATVAAQWHVLRGNQLALAWRQKGGKVEFADGVDDLTRCVELVEAVLPKLPPVAGILGAAPLFGPFVRMQRASIPLVEAWARQCDADQLMWQGRLSDYVASVRSMAGELERTAEGFLDAGADTPEVHAMCTQLRSLSDTLLARSDAVNEMRGAGPLYQSALGNKVFIIHGHAKGELLELRALLENRFGLTGRVVVLKDEAGKGQTLIQKFESWASQCCFAFALFTPDDTVAPKAAKGDGYAQARPNALFEAGWFYGRFGPQRMCIVKQVKTALPSDLGGVGTVDFNVDVKEAVIDIEKELRAASVLPPA